MHHVQIPTLNLTSEPRRHIVETYILAVVHSVYICTYMTLIFDL